MKKYIMLLVISFFTYGIMRAASSDTLSLKIVMSSDPFYKSSTLVIKNNYSSDVLVSFHFDHLSVPDFGSNAHERGMDMLRNNSREFRLSSYLYLRTLNLATNREEEEGFPLTLGNNFTSHKTNAIIKPDSIYRTPIPSMCYKYIDPEKYKILDCFVKLVYTTEDEMANLQTWKGFRETRFRDIEFDIHRPPVVYCAPKPSFGIALLR